MKRVVKIASALTMCIILGLGHVSSQESALPSEQTWNDIQTATTPTSVYDGANPSLRAAPPEGPSIGETPVGDASLAGLLLTGLVYIAFRRKRLRNRSL